MNYYNQFLQPTQIIKVNGEMGANAFQMPPNSSNLLLDANEPIVWLVQTDGAAYKTITPYDITPHTPKAQADIQSIMSRLEDLERRFNESNTPTVKRKTEQHD